MTSTTRKKVIGGFLVLCLSLFPYFNTASPQNRTPIDIRQKPLNLPREKLPSPGWPDLSRDRAPTRLPPIRISEPDLPIVANGSFHACSLTNDHILRCWGNNASAQLGIGTRDKDDHDRAIPVPGMTGVIAVAAGFLHTCAVKNNGTVWCWGGNRHGELGFDAPPPPDDYWSHATLNPQRVPGLTGVVSVATGFAHTCALKNDGTVWCWGDNRDGQVDPPSGNRRIEDPQQVIGTPRQVVGLPAVSKITAGDSHTCAIAYYDSSVWCWGKNDDGQLGNSYRDADYYRSHEHHRGPSPVVSLGRVRSITAGWRHTCALTNSGDVKCWGDNFCRQLGLPRQEGQHVPTSPIQGLTGEVAAMAANDTNTCFLMDDDTVQCVGSTAFECFDYDHRHPDRSIPTPVRDFRESSALEASRNGICVLKNSGQPLCKGLVDEDEDSLY